MTPEAATATSDVWEALYTTRAMRRLRPDPIPDEVLRRILDAAIRAPSAGNQMRFRFLVVTRPETKLEFGRLYADALDELNQTKYAGTQELLARVAADPQVAADPKAAQAARVATSARHLADHLGEAPVLLFALAKPGDEGSVFPAVWSACLAARALGVGSTVTTLLKLRRAECERLLGLPEDGDVRMMAMLPLGYPQGRWGVAQRRPLRELVFSERWGEPVPWDDPPLPF